MKECFCKLRALDDCVPVQTIFLVQPKLASGNKLDITCVGEILTDSELSPLFTVVVTCVCAGDKWKDWGVAKGSSHLEGIMY